MTHWRIIRCEYSNGEVFFQPRRYLGPIPLWFARRYEGTELEQYVGYREYSEALDWVKRETEKPGRIVNKTVVKVVR